MSKTVETQIEKSRNLIAGLKKHLKETGDTQISAKDLNDMEASLTKLENVSSEIDRLRDQLNPMVKEMNNMLASVKNVYAEQKKIIKGKYPMERWLEYGVPDKR